jgi:Putative inner membrane protein (DUF1819)
VPSEVDVIHSHLLRVTLEAEHARAYWARAAPELSLDDEADRAFAQYWFGAKSMARVRNLLVAFRARFAVYPEALAALRAWSDIDRDSRNVVCHWHVQLTDPLYRRFTGEYLPERRHRGRGDVGRDVVLQWIAAVDREGRWSPATRIGFASKLMSVAHAAGLIEGIRDPRPITAPRVPARALAYLLYLLRSLDFAGSLDDNPYLRSVGLEGGVLEDRLRGVAGVDYRRVGDLVDFEWKYSGLPGLMSGWASQTLEHVS